MKEITLKGGSLARTSIVVRNNKKVVRKRISTQEEREYGYCRWYSQLKKMQRLENMFTWYGRHSALFPSILDYGYDEREEIAYMDIEYREDAINCYEYLIKPDMTKSKAQNLLENILDACGWLHSHIVSQVKPENAMSLYFQEEIVEKINEAKLFVNPDILDKLRVKADKVWKSVYYSECLTHGNMTLENILYLQDSNEVMFIDLYEENIFDCKQADYSQLLQSSNSNYELMVDGLNCQPTPKGLIYFNDYLLSAIERDLDVADRAFVKFLECSQFYRMLPFKVKSKTNIKPFLDTANNLAKEFLDEY
jgi:hypothetical protein